MVKSELIDGQWKLFQNYECGVCTVVTKLVTTSPRQIYNLNGRCQNTAIMMNPD